MEYESPSVLIQRFRADIPSNECVQCGVKNLCLGGDLNRHQLLELTGLVSQRRRAVRGEVIYEEGDKFENLFAVASGALKSITRLGDVWGSVANLSFRGDLAGFTGVYSGRYAETAIALENTIVCEISYRRLLQYIHHDKAIGQQCHRLVARMMLQRQQAIIYTTIGSAELRVGGFLLWISDRLTERHQDPAEFSLPVKRIELATFVGLRVETVSRAFTRLREMGLVKTTGKKTRIPDLSVLRVWHATLLKASLGDG